jgi:hypothetical protein
MRRTFVALDRWQTSDELTALLWSLRRRVGDRKFRLLSVALCRRAHDFMVDERSRRAVEMTERFADALATPDELVAASEEARRAYSETYDHADGLMVERWSEVGARAYAAFSAAEAAYRASRLPPRSARHLPGNPVAVSSAVACGRADMAIIEAGRSRGANDELWRAAYRAELRAQAPLLDCIFGDPDSPVSFDQAWRTPPVIRLAEEAYRNPTPEILKVLSDCLEEAGCQDREIMGHCRGDHPHARGCWVLDGVLGKT